MVRSDLESAVHRLANHIECQLQEVLCALLAESRAADARDLIYSGCGLIESLREIRDGKGGAV